MHPNPHDQKRVLDNRTGQFLGRYPKLEPQRLVGVEPLIERDAALAAKAAVRNPC